MSTPTVYTGRTTGQAAHPRTDATKPFRPDCLRQPPQLWDDEASASDQEEARGYCLECPLFTQCLSSAMTSEQGNVSRSSMKAGLGAGDRSWLQRSSRRYGPYDAEEARLLALESVLSGRPLTEIAEREGVGGVTLKLASRILPKRPDSRIEQIAAYRRQGLGWAAIDVQMGLASRTTLDYVAKWRHSAVKRGETVPEELLVKRRPFTDEQVVAIRRRSAAGASDYSLAKELGVCRRTISAIATGVSYRDVGGPIRSSVSEAVAV
ncbi:MULTISPECIES: WhiB family transcriptional regulator [unclassified Streptomyces]|uniref:WhiB family transcriptional regulator n=1 Tax=unclassified Streptomyces TaxID=2593676 RepID=UPI00088E1B44|nr:MULTISPECIES: WhiB family transcriptional regulator [unclassified Streptomyces]PBC72322.1 transcription factor WhiB [Streptomyces sp. 2321.6]SDR62171.1 Transcription factor WhiB [Streptomyces sp. KS_16]SEE50806.1 Transcription factor WhiB [Streptomyces sp. 2133.1]SNC77826.1 Transcription factor WhiB [Streptomyces sp. 2114.4]